MAEDLREREEQLNTRELDILQRELSMMMTQQRQQQMSKCGKPTPRKRKGNFIKKKLDGNYSPHISAPSGR